MNVQYVFSSQRISGSQTIRGRISYARMLVQARKMLKAQISSALCEYNKNILCASARILKRGEEFSRCWIPKWPENTCALEYKERRA